MVKASAMKNIFHNIVLLLFLFINHVGISGTNSYKYKEFKNYNYSDSGKIGQLNISPDYNVSKYNYLDSGEYYIDSNFNFESLFPQDSIDKDVEIKFVKFKTVHSVGESYFNVCKIKNKTNKILDLDFKVNIPAGWKLLNSNILFSRSVIPGGEINIPLRLIIPQNVLGGIAYVINMVASTKDKEFYGASYVQIPEISDWNIKTTINRIYFNELYNSEDFEIRLSNKGNSQQIINLKFRTGKNLKILDSTTNNNIFISIPPFSDTLLTYTAIKINKSEIADYAPGNFRDSEIIVTALDRKGRKKIKYFKFFDLDNNLYNQRDEECSPLNLSFRALNIASGMNPFIGLGAYGEIQLNENHDFNYNANFSNINFGNQTFSSYFNNPGLYNFQLNHNWDNKLLTSVGNINTSNPLFNFQSTGIRSSYSFENGSNVNFIFANSRVFPEWFASSAYSSKILIPGIKKNVSYKLSLGYSNSSYRSFRSVIPELFLSFSPIKKHNISLDIMPRLGNFTSANPSNNDSSVIGNSYNLNYSGSIKKIRFNFGQLNTLNGLHNSQSLRRTNGSISCKINKKSNLKFYSLGQYFSPSRLGFIQSSQITYLNTSQNINRLSYNLKFNKKISFSVGPSLQSNYRERFIQRDTILSGFLNETFGFFGSMNVRLKNKESLSPSIFLGNTRFKDRLVDTLSYKGASNISFGINYLNPIWSLNFRYMRGVNFFIDQNIFITEETKISNETIFIRANFKKEIPSRKISLQGSCNWFLRMPVNISNFGLSGRMSFQINRRLNGFTNTNLFTTRSSNVEDGSSSSRFFNINFGLTYNVDIPQPKIKYYDLKIVCFKDLNGDKIKSDNEEGIPNIILNISRDYESDFLNILFSEMELISDQEGNIVLKDLPEGDFFLVFRSLVNLGVLHNTKGNEQEISMQEDYTLFIPYGEGYKVIGQVIISRDINSSLGAVKPSRIRVDAVSSTGEIYSTLTDDNGSFSISVPLAGYYKVSLNNVFGDNFHIKNNKMIVQFDGFKVFRVDFDVVEKSRDVIIKGSSKFNFGSQ